MQTLRDAVVGKYYIVKKINGSGPLKRMRTKMAITIAFAGNPNSGKSTLFNCLTGSNQYVGNWPGVTVEKRLLSIKK